MHDTNLQMPPARAVYFREGQCNVELVVSGPQQELGALARSLMEHLLKEHGLSEGDFQQLGTCYVMLLFTLL